MKWKIQLSYFLLAVLLFWCVQSQSLAHAEYEYPQPVYGVWIKYTVDKPVKQANSNNIGKGGYCRQADGTYLKVECSCTCYAKQLVGYEGSIGAAQNWKTNSKTPAVGAVMIQSSKPFGHASVVLLVEQDRVYVREANHTPCKVTERWVDLNDKSIIGFWIDYP